MCSTQGSIIAGSWEAQTNIFRLSCLSRNLDQAEKNFLHMGAEKIDPKRELAETQQYFRI